MKNNKSFFKILLSELLPAVASNELNYETRTLFY